MRSVQLSTLIIETTSMNLKLVVLLFLASLSLASEVNLSSPSSAVQSYTSAINEGDLVALKKVMVSKSYDTDIQVYVLSIALNDPSFHKALKMYSTSEKAKKIVEDAVEQKLQKRKNRVITIKKEIPLGKNRVMVRFIEENKKKQLYVNFINSEWRIDYLAGRKTD